MRVFHFFLLFVLLLSSCISQVDYEQVRFQSDSSYIREKKSETYKSIDMNTVRKVQLSDGTVVKCVDLVLSEVEQLLIDKSGHKVERFKDAEFLVYELNDGSVILANEDDAILYFSMSDALKVIDDWTNEKRADSAINIFLNKNPFGQNFPAKAKFLSAQLVTELNLSPGLIGLSLMKQIDDCILQKPDPVEVYMHFFINLVSVVGEALVAEDNAAWRMIYDADCNVWEPRLYCGSKSINIGGWIWEDVYNRQDHEWPVLTEAYCTAKELIGFNS